MGDPFEDKETPTLGDRGFERAMAEGSRFEPALDISDLA